MTPEMETRWRRVVTAALLVLVVVIVLSLFGCTHVERLCPTSCVPGWVCIREGCTPVYGGEPCPTRH